MILPASYANGFAPRDGQSRYPSLWNSCGLAVSPCLGPTGLILRDWSGFGGHGTLTNMDGTDWVQSQGRYALDFDGANDYVNCGNVSRMQQAGNLTASCWFIARTLSAERGLITRSDNGDTGFQLLTNGTSLRWPRYNAGLSYTVATNTLYHACGVHRNGINELWVNGVLRGTLTEAMGATTVNAVIGRLYANAAAFYSDALIFDAMMHHRPLQPAEIRLLATRPGIAYDLAPRRRSSSAVAFNRRRRLLLGST
jgi:hypothetical protein